MEMAEQTLMNELNKLLRKKFRSTFKDVPEEPVVQTGDLPSDKQLQVDINNTEFQEKDVIRLLLNYGPDEFEFEQETEDEKKEKVMVKVASFIVNDLLRDEIIFNDITFQKIFVEYAELLNENIIPSDKHFINHSSKILSAKAIDLLTSPYELSENWESVARIDVVTEDQKINAAVVNAVLSFKAKKIEQLIAQNQEELKKAEDNGEDSADYLIKHMELKHISRSINAQLGRVITR
jgi:DNA primase